MDEQDMDIDAILRDREETLRETGVRGTLQGLKSFGGVGLSDLSSTTPTLPTPVEDEEYNDDDFADFDFEPSKPTPPPVVKTTPAVAITSVTEPAPLVTTAPVITPVAAPSTGTSARTSSIKLHQETTDLGKPDRVSSETPKQPETVTSTILAGSDRRISASIPSPAPAIIPVLVSAPIPDPVTKAPAPPVITSSTLPAAAAPEKALKLDGNVVAVDYDNYDPFDDFEYDAQKPKRTVILDPRDMREFKDMDRKSEASHSSGQDKSRPSEGHSSERNTGKSLLKNAVASIVQQARQSESVKPGPVAELHAEADNEDEMLNYSRERSTNTMAAKPAYSRPVVPTNFQMDPSLEDANTLRNIERLVSKTKDPKVQEEAISKAFDPKTLKEMVAQELSDISFSDQELEDNQQTTTSPTREASKTKASLEIQPESAAFRSKEAKLKSKLEELRSKANEKSKMHSIFLSRPQEEFERMAYTYHEEISKVKESTGKLKIDLDSMNVQTSKAGLAEINVENIRPNFFEYFKSKYGHVRAFIPDRSGVNVIVATDKGQLVLFENKMIDNYVTLQLSTTPDDHPTCLFADWDAELLWVGMSKGDVWAVKHSPSENTLKKFAHAKDFSPNSEILDLVVSKNREHLVVIDGEYRVLHGKLEKNKSVDKVRIASTQIGFTKRDVLPHLEIKEVAPDVYLCVVAAGVEVIVYELKPDVKNQKSPNCVQMLQMEVDQSANIDSSIMLPLYPVGNEPGRSESGSTLGDSNILSLGDEKSEGDASRKGRRVSETNESYPLLVMLSDDPNRTLVLALCFKRTLYIFDLHPTPEKTFRTQTIAEIKIRARAVNISYFSSGKIILMDILNDFYLIDVPLGVKYNQTHGTAAKPTPTGAADIAGLIPGVVPTGVPQTRPSPSSTSIRSTSVRASVLTNSINKTREFLSSLNGNKAPSNANGTLLVDSTQEYDYSCVFLIYPFGNVDQILSTQTKTRSLTSYSSLISKSTKGEYYFLNQKGLIKLNIMDWRQYLDACLEHQNYLKALKTVNELLDGEFETLRRPPPKRQLPGELAPYIRRIFEEFVVELKMAPPEDIEIFVNYCMMTLIKNGMHEYITEDLEAIMDEHDLLGYFWRSLMLLFRSHLIPSLEFEKIMRIVNFLENDPLEKQRFILYLFNRKLYREMLFNNLANRGNINLLFFLSDKVDEPHKSTFALEYVKDSIEIHGQDPEKRAKFYFQMFWYVSEFVEKKLEKRDVKYKDHSWYILNWFFNPELVAFLIKKDLKAYLEGWFFLFEKKFPQLMAFNNGLDLLEGFQLSVNEIVNLKKTCPEMVSLISYMFSYVKNNPQDLNYFYFWIAIVKFHKVPCIELNDNALKELVLTLIKNINEIVSDSRLGITHEDLNILIFATFTEHKDIFLDNSELKDLIMKNEKSLRLLYHEMNRDMSATFSLYRKLSRDNEQFKFRMFQWLKKNIEIKGEREATMSLIKTEFSFLVSYLVDPAHRGRVVLV